MKAAFLITNKKDSRRLTFHGKEISDDSRNFFVFCGAQGDGSQPPTFTSIPTLLVVTAFVETARCIAQCLWMRYVSLRGFAKAEANSRTVGVLMAE